MPEDGSAGKIGTRLGKKRNRQSPMRGKKAVSTTASDWRPGPMPDRFKPVRMEMKPLAAPATSENQPLFHFCVDGRPKCMNHSRGTASAAPCRYVPFRTCQHIGHLYPVKGYKYIVHICDKKSCSYFYFYITFYSFFCYLLFHYLL